MSRHACLVVGTILVVLTSVTCLSVRSSSRKGKFVYPYIVKIAAGPCRNFMGYYGTCYSNYECGRRGGIGTGSCAKGYGVCCVGMVTCNEQVLLNDTYFQNPDYPSASGVSNCPVTIRRPPNICQVRIDFEVFDISGPDPMTGVCNTDSFTVDVPGSTRSKVPTLCGTFSNEHMYVDFEGSDYMTLNYMGTSNAKKWKNRIQMIECNSLLRAPDGCLQYYYSSGGTGQVEILGYNPSLPPHLANLKYTLCVRREVGRDSITWEVCNARSFSMSENVPAMMAGALQDTVCTKDYIQMLGRAEISDGAGATAYSDNVFCGTALSRQQNSPTNQPITTSAKPFVIHVETDDMEAPDDVDNIGFCLTYRQA